MKLATDRLEIDLDLIGFTIEDQNNNIENLEQELLQEPKNFFQKLISIYRLIKK